MKKESGILRKGIAGFELGILIISLFAFSFFIYSLDVVSGFDIEYESYRFLYGAEDIYKTAPSSLNTPTTKFATGSPSAWSGTPVYAESALQLPTGTYTAGTLNVGAESISLTGGKTAVVSAAKTGGYDVVVSNSDGTVALKTSGTKVTAGANGATGAAPNSGSKLSNLLGASGGTGADAICSRKIYSSIE